MLLSGVTTSMILLAVIVIVILLFISTGVKVVKLDENMIVERLGVYNCTLEAGLHFVFPFIDRVVGVISTSERDMSIPTASYITRDDQKIQVEAKIMFQIFDAKLFHYGLKSIEDSITQKISDNLKNQLYKISYDSFGDELERVTEILIEDANMELRAAGVKINRVTLNKYID